jgi:hypothetical protein
MSWGTCNARILEAMVIMMPINRRYLYFKKYLFKYCNAFIKNLNAIYFVKCEDTGKKKLKVKSYFKVNGDWEMGNREKIIHQKS